MVDLVDMGNSSDGSGDGSGIGRVGIVVDEIHIHEIRHDPEIHDHVHLDELHFVGWC
jgi:hypothetical protein